MSIFQIILLSLLLCLSLFLIKVLIARIKSSYIRNTKVIPQQLAIVVEQAYTGISSTTLWNVMISNDMRIALCSPLTAEQIQTVWREKDDIICCSVRCKVLSHKLRSNKLSGVVSVSADIMSHSGRNDYSISEAKLQITIEKTDADSVMGPRWYVSSAVLL